MTMWRWLPRVARWQPDATPYSSTDHAYNSTDDARFASMDCTGIVDQHLAGIGFRADSSPGPSVAINTR